MPAKLKFDQVKVGDEIPAFEIPLSIRAAQNQGALRERRTGTGFALAKLSEILRLRSQTHCAQRLCWKSTA